MARLRLAPTLLGAALVLAGCSGGDDDRVSATEAASSPSGPSASASEQSASASEESGSASADATDPPAGNPDAAAFCSAMVAADAALAAAPDDQPGSPAPDSSAAAWADFAEGYLPLVEDAERAAPAQIAEDAAGWARLVRAAVEDGTDPMREDAIAPLDSRLDDYLVTECGFPEIGIFAVDYEFTRIPTAAAAGPTAISVANDGQELHQLVLLRVDDDVTDSLADLLQLDGEELAERVEVVSEVYIRTGIVNTSFADLTPGRYLAVCFVPVGSKRGAIGDGEPHHAEGMAEEFEVLEP